MISRVSYLAQRRISGKKEWLISDRHESLALYFANLCFQILVPCDKSVVSRLTHGVLQLNSTRRKMENPSREAPIT